MSKAVGMGQIRPLFGARTFRERQGQAAARREADALKISREKSTGTISLKAFLEMILFIRKMRRIASGWISWRPKVKPVPLTPLDHASIAAAQAKRDRKAARNLALVASGGMQAAPKWGGRWFELAA